MYVLYYYFWVGMMCVVAVDLCVSGGPPQELKGGGELCAAALVREKESFTSRMTF